MQVTANPILRSSPRGLLVCPFLVFGRDTGLQSSWSSEPSSRDVDSMDLQVTLAVNGPYSLRGAGELRESDEFGAGVGAMERVGPESSRDCRGDP